VLVSALLVLTSATLYAACFPPWSFTPLIWVALIPFLVALTRHGPLRGALLGLLWGTAIGVETGTWFPGMISVYFEQPAWIGWLSLPVIGMAHAGIYCAAFGAAVGWMARAGVASPGRVALAWAGYELVRARAFGGDPWVLSGYALVHWPTLTQTADLAGPYAGGMLVAAVNALVASRFVPDLRGRRQRWSTAAVGCAVVATIVYGRWQLTRPAPTPDVPVMVVQAGVGRGLHWLPEYQRVGLAEHLALSSTSTAPPALIVWPEYAVSFYPQEASREREELLDGSRRFGSDLVLGAPHYAFTDTAGTVYHNSVFLVRDGDLAGRYDKRRLVPFAETTGTTHYTGGVESGVLTSRAGRLGIFLCFEAMYPELVRETVAGGAQLLLNLSNDSWFGSEAAARHHLEIASFRAIESRRWLLRAATTGYSAVIDPQGRLSRTSSFGRPDVLNAMIVPLDGTTVYQRTGDTPLAIALALAVLLTIRMTRLAR
jgi:apolipoprotein N-acyltransferase